MALLDSANTGTYGNLEITKVNIGVRNNPGILVSGHDLKVLELLLKQTEGTGVDVYTHSEMLQLITIQHLRNTLTLKKTTVMLGGSKKRSLKVLMDQY